MPQMSSEFAELEPSSTPKTSVPGYVQHVLDLAADHTASIDRKYWAVHELLAFGYIDKATALLNTLPSTARRMNKLERIEQIEAGEQLLKHVIPDIRTDMHVELGRKLTGIMVIPSVEPTPYALIFFGGNGDRNFTLPHPVINRQHLHLIFIKDNLRCFSLCDIARLGPGFEANVPVLKQILEELEATSVYCMGVSAGAFPALKFGLELGANGVLAFSGPPSLEIAEDPGATLAKYPQLTQLYKRARHLATSMPVEYAQRPVHPSVIMVYGEHHPRDSFFAAGMSGVAGVKMAPVVGYAGHGAFTESLSKERLPALLDELVTTQPVNEPEKHYDE